MTTPSVQYAIPLGEPLTGYQRAVLTLQGTIAGGLIALAALAWFAVERLEARDAARQRELRQFHAQLVANIGELAERAGWLTSADLCPIRFRARMSVRQSPPARSLTAQLTRLEPPGDVLVIESTGAGIIDFGLHPPGRYQLHLSTQDGYALRHEFDVLPGVPIDRLVLCPNRDSGVGSHIVFPLPDRLASAGLIAAFCLEQDDVTIDDWTWRPIDRGRCWVVSADADVLEELAAELASTGRLDGEVGCEFAFRYCRLLAVSFWHPGTGLEPPREVKRFVFSGHEAAPAARDDVVMLQSDPPRYVRDPNTTLLRWALQLPAELQEALQTWSPEATGAVGTQWSGTDTIRRTGYGKVRYEP